jgi:glycosyltransferase involved in cell wall biosynthesis
VSKRLVLHVINSIGLSGGAEAQLVANVRRFSDPQIAHHVAYLYHGERDSWAAELSVPVTRINGSSDRAALLVSGLRLLRLVHTLEPDLIHCSLMDASLLSRVVGRLTRTPVLESLVNISHEPIRTVDSGAVKMWKLGIYQWLDRLTMSRVTAFHALTDEVARSWVQTVGLDPGRITVIPRGISLDALGAARLSQVERDRFRRELVGDPNALLVLAVGREEPQKGHRYLLEAFSAVRDRRPDAHLVMAGRGGSSSSALDATVDELGIGSSVHRLGIRTDVYRLMRASDLMVFPSLYEGLGVSLIEGMGSGLPVVVFDRPPMNQIVNDHETGLVVADRDPKALAEAILALATDTQVAMQLGANAEARVRADYDIAETARRVEELYREVLAGATRQQDRPRRARETS